MPTAVSMLTFSLVKKEFYKKRPPSEGRETHSKRAKPKSYHRHAASSIALVLNFTAKSVKTR